MNEGCFCYNSGKLVEYDEPTKLMEREGSLFGQLVNEYWSHYHSAESHWSSQNFPVQIHIIPAWWKGVQLRSRIYRLNNVAWFERKGEVTEEITFLKSLNRDCLFFNKSLMLYYMLSLIAFYLDRTSAMLAQLDKYYTQVPHYIQSEKAVD